MRLWLMVFAVPLSWGQPRGILSDPGSVEAGKQLYLGSCSGCHGKTGEGSQGPSLLSGRASRLADKTLFDTIRNGLPGTTMPNFPLPEEKVWQIASFVRSLTVPAVAGNPGGDPERGRAFFFGAGRCMGCHMIQGKGGSLGPDLSNIGAERTLPQLVESITMPSERIEDGYRGATAVRRDGQKVQGVAKNYNNYSVQILDRTGRLHLLDRAELTSFEVQDKSLMPAVSKGRDADDVLAFLAKQSMRPYEGASR